MPFRSKAQQRWMFSAEARGELPKGTAKKWARHTKNIKKLPERVKKAEDAQHPDIPPYEDTESGTWTRGVERDGISKTGFVHGFRKTASGNLAMDAAQESSMLLNQDTFVPGSSLRGEAETGQTKGKNYRTPGVKNEEREFNQAFKKKTQTARGGKHYGGTLYKGIFENGSQEEFV